MPPARKYGHIEHSSLICAMNDNRTLVLCQDLVDASWLLNSYVKVHMNGGDNGPAKAVNSLKLSMENQSDKSGCVLGNLKREVAA